MSNKFTFISFLGKTGINSFNKVKTWRIVVVLLAIVPDVKTCVQYVAVWPDMGWIDSLLLFSMAHTACWAALRI